MKLASALTALLSFLCVVPAFAQQTTRADFNELCQAMTGRWLCNFNLLVDSPGEGRKGDAATAVVEIFTSADGNALVARILAGATSGYRMTVYDAAAKQIRELGARSDGRMWTAVYFKEKGQWVKETAGCTPEGVKNSGVYRVAISDNGNTHTWTGAIIRGGEKLPPYREVAKR
jgi:hypothetical protein